MKSPCWQEGYDAFNAGFDFDTNPYPADFDLAEEWDRGFNAAADDLALDKALK